MPRWRVLAVGIACVVVAVWAGIARATLVNVVANTFETIAGAPFSGEVGSFESTIPPNVGIPFSASINWGDGTAADAGTVAFLGPSQRNTFLYRILGSHTWASPGSYTLTVAVREANGPPGTGTGTVRVLAAPPPPQPPPPPPQPPPPPPSADLELTQTQTPKNPKPGDRLTYRLRVDNNGPDAATGVILTSGAPPGSVFISATVAETPTALARSVPGECTGTNPIVCDLGTLQPNGAALVTHVVRLTRPGVARNSATVEAQEADPTPDNHEQAQAVPVVVPPPQAGRTVNAARVSGQVFVRRPGTQQFVPLGALTQIPNGSLVDTRRGRVRLFIAGPGGVTQSAVFYDGLFTILQKRVVGAFAELRLQGGNFKGICAAKRFLAATKPKKPVRRLWGDGKGRFRTRGRYSSAAIRGTKWLTQDRCDGTLTRSVLGSVTVVDFRRKRRVILRPGQSYLAPAP